jgi:uncharacterized membrane protein
MPCAGAPNRSLTEGVAKHVAVGYYSQGCDEESDWASRGWYRLEPGQSATVLWTTNDYSTFYAEADDGA